jgi:hypothetical protein
MRIRIPNTGFQRGLFLVQEDAEEETYDQEQEEESREAESFQSYIAGHQDKISKKVQQQRAAIHKPENT